MPFQGNRIVIIIILIAIIFIGAVAFLASQQQNKPAKGTDETSVSVTILNNIGVKEIEIQNLNTGKTYTFTLLTLPGAFNCTAGDYLQLRVSTHEGYRWNGWWFTPMDIWNNDNPAIISASGHIVYKGTITMRPDCILLEQQTPDAEPFGGE